MRTINAYKTQQRGGTILGLIIGVLIGLGVALGIAMYVMKVPTPFNKGINRSTDQDAAEAAKNKDWDPNAGLGGKSTNKPTEVPPAPAAVAPPPSMNTNNAPPTPQATPAPVVQQTVAPATITGVEYYIQVGAYRSQDEANATRGKLALSGFEGKIVEREQSDHTVYRVRVGPYATQASGDKVKASLESAGFETVLVRTQR